MTPTQRTLAVLKAQRVTAQVVERWIPFAELKNPQPGVKRPPGVRQDLFGLFDILALRSVDLTYIRIVGIQCCAMSGRAEHLLKMHASPFLIDWLRAGGLVELWCWRKLLLKRGAKAKRWRYEITTVGDRIAFRKGQPC